VIYLFAAYTAIWILLFTYVASISSRQRRLDQEMETLRKLLEQKKQRP
jgi:CcmD family protein